MCRIVYFCSMKRTIFILVCCFLSARGVLRAETSTTPIETKQPGDAVDSLWVVRQGEERLFTADTLSDALFARMCKFSFRGTPPVKREALRYLRVLHRDGKGNIRIGEMVCNRSIAADLLDIFRTLYRAGYPIERMVLIDNYGADDERSMQANNSSCFNHRPATGRKVTLSKHAYGLAVDINPLYNPYCKQRSDGTWKVSPTTATQYRRRTTTFPYKIVRSDLLCRLFLQHGFAWGGDWKSCKDYQHFEK